MAETGAKVTRVYSGFRGVDFRSEECDLTRSPDALNVWRNYKKTSGIETRPALKKYAKVAEENGYDTSISAISWHTPKDGGDDALHILTKDGRLFWTSKGGDVSGGHLIVGKNGTLFSFQGTPYVKGAEGYWNAHDGMKVEGVVPITSIGSLPDGTGRKTNQDVNMLTPYRINTFRADGKSRVFYLDAESIDSDEIPKAYLNGKYIFENMPLAKEYDNGEFFAYYYGELKEGEETTSDFIVVNYDEGTVDIVKGGSPLPAAESSGDNVSIKFKKTVKDADGNDANKDKILGCTIVQEFDNRIFLSGNKDYPNLVFHSGLNDASYFSDLDVYEDGKDDGYIRAMVSGNNALWVFRDTSQGNGVYYHTASFDNAYGKVYPSAHSSVSMGCVGGAVNFLDDILFFSRNGMESISQNITAEQFATHKSSLVDRIMLDNTEYKSMVLAEWEGYLLVFVGNEVYLADSRAILANEGHYEYEWYKWELFKKGDDKVTCATVHNGELYIATEAGYIFTFDKNATNGDEYYSSEGDYSTITSYWTTPKDKFYAPNKVKNTNKKGCVIECAGDLTISSKVDDGNGFDEGDTFTGVTDHIVTKIKRKKFKDMQLKFTSTTDFTLESATLEAFVGSYIK